MICCKEQSNYICMYSWAKSGYKLEQNLVPYLDFTERWRGGGVNLN